MNPNNIYDFTLAHRQSPVAILLVVFKTLRVVIKQVFLPFLFFVLLGKKGNDFGTYFVVFACVISGLSMIYSIINYYRSYFHIVGNELIVISGIIGRNKLSIPLERIQTINFEQNIIHRIFGVKSLKIDTAGSNEKEFELSALDDEKAEALRFVLLSKRSVSENHDILIQDIRKNEIRIMSMTPGELIRAGLFENHFKSGALIFVFFWWIYANLQEIGINAEDYIKKVPDIGYSIRIFLFAILLFLIISVIISLVRTVINYYGLGFFRINRGFKINYGLLNTKSISAMDHKIQSIAWTDNLLKKTVGINDLKLRQAGSKEVNTKDAITIPGCTKDHILQVSNFLYPDLDIESMPITKVDVSFYIRNLLFSILLPLPFIATSLYFGSYISAVIGAIVMIYFIVMAKLGYQKLGYGYNKELLKLKGGAFGDKNIISPIFKTQSIEIKQNPFQRRKNLVNIIVYNASGSETIPFIKEQEANLILNYFIHKAETDHRNWM